MTKQKKYRIQKLFFIIWIVSTCSFINNNTIAQDIHFSQYVFSPLAINPALAGAFNGDVRVLTSYRDQWHSITVPFKSFTTSCDLGLFKKKFSGGYLGAGIYMFSDKAGTSQMSHNQVNLSIAYHLMINQQHVISAGIQGGIAQRNVNSDNLSWDNQFNGTSYDPALPAFEPDYSDNITYSDFAVGLQWNFSMGEMYATANNQKNFNAGFSVFHLTRPMQSFYSETESRLPFKIIFHANALAGIKNTNTSILPSFIYMQQGPFTYLIAGSLFRYKLKEESKYTSFVKGAAISFGGHYRFGDALIPSLMFEFGNYALGISYDINTSELVKATGGFGGFEISLRFINPNPFTGKSGYIKSPRFFY